MIPIRSLVTSESRSESCRRPAAESRNRLAQLGVRQSENACLQKSMEALSPSTNLSLSISLTLFTCAGAMGPDARANRVVHLCDMRHCISTVIPSGVGW